MPPFGGRWAAPAVGRRLPVSRIPTTAVSPTLNPSAARLEGLAANESAEDASQAGEMVSTYFGIPVGGSMLLLVGP